MHILFIGYGKTSQRVAKQLFQQDHQITTVSLTTKDDPWAQHLQQNIHQLDLTAIAAIDVVYILLSPAESSVAAYKQTYVDSVEPIVQALSAHPIQKILLVSSTRVYGQNNAECINDESALNPSDERGELLLQMEQLWQHAYPEQCIIVRPSGIYGTSVERMLKLAQSTRSYPNIHWSNRIHIDDLAGFLSHLLELQQTEKSYICSDGIALPLHEIITWFQLQRELPLLSLESQNESGKKQVAQRMLETGFKLAHGNCFDAYTDLMDRH